MLALNLISASNPLADLFPTGPTAGESQPVPAPKLTEEEALDSMIKTSTSQLKSRRVIAEDDLDTPRPGAFYARYRTESDLPDTARSFYETTAKVVGVSLPTLVRAVSQAENKITLWLEEQRRVEYFGDALDMEFIRDSSTDMDDEQSMSELDDSD